MEKSATNAITPTTKIGHETNGDNSPITGDIQQTHVNENTGVVGGTGHTITINQFPKELIVIFENILKNGIIQIKN
jgi:hypothetical protein